VYVDGEKYSLAHPSMRPAAAIIDPELTYSMPARVTAATGLDALCQATESLWAVGSTEQSRQHAAEAIRLSMEHLEAAVRRPNPEDRRGMCLAAHRAGQAIDVSKTTAAHALAYALTTDYRLPHGMAAALSLPPLLEFNAAVTDDDCADPRGPEHVRGMLGRIVELMECPTPFHAARRLTVLLESIDAPATLSEVGIATEPERLRLASRVNAERLSNNPRRLAQADVERLLASIA
jgi:alcohol dehydrogenase class IV